MMFVTGPLFAGKRDYVRSALGWSEEELSRRCVWDVQDLVQPDTDLEQLAEELARKDVVIATEVGGGVVPVDPHQRACREGAGRLACLLAQKADTVVRVCCGLPQCLKGQMP